MAERVMLPWLLSVVCRSARERLPCFREQHLSSLGKEGPGANITAQKGRRKLVTEASLAINLDCGKACKLGHWVAVPVQEIFRVRGCLAYRAGKVGMARGRGKSGLQRNCINVVPAQGETEQDPRVHLEEFTGGLVQIRPAPP